jgi:hypothetical protein
MRSFHQIALVTVLPIVAAAWLTGSEQDVTPLKAAETTVSYKKDIQPILQNNCYNCHNSMKKKAGIDLRSGYTNVAKIVKPEKPDDSRLFKCLVGKGAKLMPPKNPLPEETVNKVKAWIEDGAKNN